MAEYKIPVDDISDGDHITVQIKGREITVFNIDGRLRAYLNWCAHQGGPACEGTITGTGKSSFDRDTLESKFEWCREGEILNCPWHGWEYDIENGDCLSRNGVQLSSYPVHREDGDIIISL